VFASIPGALQRRAYVSLRRNLRIGEDLLDFFQQLYPVRVIFKAPCAESAECGWVDGIFFRQQVQKLLKRQVVLRAVHDFFVGELIVLF
jgi:hypothetical protein